MVDSFNTEITKELKWYENHSVEFWNTEIL